MTIPSQKYIILWGILNQKFRNLMSKWEFSYLQSAYLNELGHIFSPHHLEIRPVYETHWRWKVIQGFFRNSMDMVRVGNQSWRLIFSTNINSSNVQCWFRAQMLTHAQCHCLCLHLQLCFSSIKISYPQSQLFDEAHLDGTITPDGSTRARAHLSLLVALNL